MGALLIETWLAGTAPIAVRDDASVSEVREAVRTHGAARGLPALAIEKLAAAVSELARNQLAHAAGGEIGLRAIERAGVAGLEVIAADRGRGIADPTTALRGSPRAEGSLGVGLSAASRQVDELDLDIRYGAGTCVTVRSFAAPVPRSELGIVARAHPEETVIGDSALAIRSTDSLLLGVADGLGHGPLAREAADRAIETMQAHPTSPFDEQLRSIHAAVTATRGAVMAIARLSTDRLNHVGVGNISTRVIGADGASRLLASTAGTLGSAFPRRLHVDEVVWKPGDLLVLCSDGLTSRVELGEPGLTRQHPIVIAQKLLTQFARGNDDALVAVVR